MIVTMSLNCKDIPVVTHLEMSSMSSMMEISLSLTQTPGMTGDAVSTGSDGGQIGSS